MAETGLNNENPKVKKSFFRRLINFFLFLIALLLIAAFLVFFVLYLAPSIQETRPEKSVVTANNEELLQNPDYKKMIPLMKKDIQTLSKEYNNYTSGQSYIVINTIDYRFKLYTNKQLVREGLCSVGANIILKVQGGKEYYFRTPKGEMTITGKRKHPYWHRSDWDYIEQGLPVPPKDDPSRWEYGMLGDYALDMRDGYMIHGTIYKRMMGMPVTHGCVRLMDEDLEVVFKTLNIGSKVYVF